ncbi:hypothetical protein K402DRAFT_343684, partial [Aulographum hederae CBS 113979]
PFEAWMRAVVARTDGKARRLMWEKFEKGEGVDQKKVLREWTDGYTAVVNGADEPYVELGYVDGVEYGRLWEGRCHRIEGGGHAPFWERREEFGEIYGRFIRDCEEL